MTRTGASDLSGSIAACAPMGKLAGFRYREIVRRLKKFGFEFYREGAGCHEIWRNPSTFRHTTIPNHPGDMLEGFAGAVLKQAAISPDEFLELQ